MLCCRLTRVLTRPSGPRRYPGSNVGPEPTTDRFMAIMHGQDDRVLPGNAVAVSPGKPFRGLQTFGNAFLQKFHCAEVRADILESMTLIDTPGVLSGEKQRIGRNYDMAAVTKWFAERSDLILILFDAHKLDISDELKTVIEGLKGNDDKIRIVLNKADQVSSLPFVVARAISRVFVTVVSECILLSGHAAAAHARVRRADVVARKGTLEP
jgi:hypothetical protein